VNPCIRPFENTPGKEVEMSGIVRIEIGRVMVPANNGNESVLSHAVESSGEGEVERHGEGIMSNQNIESGQRISEVTMNLVDEGLRSLMLALQT
jgi:hypothetical protein